MKLFFFAITLIVCLVIDYLFAGFLNWPGVGAIFAITLVGGYITRYLHKILNKLNKNDSHTNDET